MYILFSVMKRQVHHHTHYQIVGGKYLSKVTLIIATSLGIYGVTQKIPFVQILMQEVLLGQ